MRNFNKLLIYLLLLIFWCTTTILAQPKIQVVTRTISKSFEKCIDCKLNIVAEKADINILPSKDHVIRLKLMLVSKNPSKEEAEADLKYCDYRIIENDESLSILNSFIIGTNPYTKINSNLSARYEIELPSGSKLKLKNIYGDITINGINATQNITIDFGQLILKNVSGDINIMSNYCDIKGNDIKATCNIQAQNSDITLSEIKNNLKIKPLYGIINLENINASVDLEAEMTEINLTLDNLNIFRFDISALKCDLSAPVELKRMITRSSGKVNLTHQSGNILLKIRNTYSPININLR